MASPDSKAAKYRPGTVLLSKYRVESLLGQGGMGVVVKARHTRLNQLVAIKFLSTSRARDHELAQRFLREAQAAANLRSEHVCRVFDVGQLADGTPYMVMEYLSGMELGRLLATEGRLRPTRAVDLMLQACVALAEAHAQGIVHRDVKPANFFVSVGPDGSQRLKVLDFGVSKAASEIDGALTSTQAVLGTPLYMSPEQMRASKDVDQRADIWALGVVLYEALTGARPFRGRAFSEICLKVGMDPTPALGVPVPAGLEDAVRRCLEKEPDHRFQNVAQLAAAIGPFASNPASAMSWVNSAARILNVARPPAATPHTRAPTGGRGDHQADSNSAGRGSGAPTSTLGGSVGQFTGPETARRASTGWLVGLVAGLGLGLAVAVAVIVDGADEAPSVSADQARHSLDQPADDADAAVDAAVVDAAVDDAVDDAVDAAVVDAAVDVTVVDAAVDAAPDFGRSRALLKREEKTTPPVESEPKKNQAPRRGRARKSHETSAAPSTDKKPKRKLRNADSPVEPF